MAAPILSKSDVQSAVWLKLKAHFEAELDERRAYNDGESLTDKETAIVRGQIKHIKRVLKIEADAQ